MIVKYKAILTIPILVAFSVVGLPAGAHDNSTTDNQASESKSAEKYAYATRGVIDIPNRMIKLLLDETNFGGKELELAEITFAAGSIGGEHKHGSVEIFYVLSGSLGHEVNGELHWLSPGMVGVVRPGDTVRHIAPKDSDVKTLVIWTPAGEAKRIGINTQLRCSDPKQIATYIGGGGVDQAKFECKGP